MTSMSPGPRPASSSARRIVRSMAIVSPGQVLVATFADDAPIPAIVA
jgi:hypothetical protein